MVREWLRVSCRGKNDKGGTPTTVQVTAGAGVFTFVSAGVVSLILPFIEGTMVRATFSWTDASHRLALAWPKGSPQPVVLGAFEGADSPLDHAPALPVAGEIACQCDMAINGSTMCLPNVWLGKNVAACEKKYLGDCRTLMRCADGEPSLQP